MNLGNLSVQELSLEEQINIDGGIVIGTAILCFAAGVAIGSAAMGAVHWYNS